jgi:hypothetical protein
MSLYRCHLMAWVEAAKEPKRSQGVARRVVARLLNQRVSVCFHSWVDAVGCARQERTAAAQRAAEQDARKLLLEQCRKGIVLQLMRVCMIRRHRLLMQDAVESWKHAVSQTRMVLLYTCVFNVATTFDCFGLFS